MPVTQSYNRAKVAATNSTGMVLSWLVGEGPITPHILYDDMGVADLGTTGVLTAKLRCDADESGGSDVQDYVNIVVTPSTGTNGQFTLTIVATPVNGDGTLGTSTTTVITHPQNFDTWQSAAGRARQA
jgi:hypothetical protein